MNPSSLPDSPSREALRHAAEFRLIGLLFERPSSLRARQAPALALEAANEPLRSATGTLAAIEAPDYDSLLGPGGPASPREAAYIRRRDPAQVMAEASAFYEAFGYRPVAGEPVDHVATEAGFAGYLWLKEAYAMARGDAEAADVTRAAREKFVAEHLSVVAGGLATRLEGAPEPAWSVLAETLLSCAGGRRLPEAELESEEMEDDMSCGACGAEGKEPPA